MQYPYPLVKKTYLGFKKVIVSSYGKDGSFFFFWPYFNGVLNSELKCLTSYIVIRQHLIRGRQCMYKTRMQILAKRRNASMYNLGQS